MKRTLVFVSAIALAASSAMAVWTPYTGTWSQSWDFNTGAQGWALTGLTVDSGSLLGYDNQYAKLFPGLNLGASATDKHFVLQADVYCGTAGNFLQDIGLQAGQTTNYEKGPQIAGSNNSNQGMTAIDKSWWNTTGRQSWVLTAGQWVTVQIQYGEIAGTGNAAGKWSAAVLGATGSSYPGQWRINKDNEEANPTGTFDELRVGSMANAVSGGAWSNGFRIDNVKLFYTPEPATLSLLALGLLGLRRRR